MPTWSPQQQTIFDAFKTGRKNVVVRARAGTGKTTTILEGIGHAPENRILLAAFNKRIAEELKTKLKNPCAEAKTLHSIGFGFVLRSWENTRLDGERAWNLAKEAAGFDAPDGAVTLVSKLAGKGKNVKPFGTKNDLVDLAYQFDLEPDEELEEDGWNVDRLALAAVQAMSLAASKRDGTIDFDDMIFLPVRNKWIRPRYDLVVIDEAQDMNACQIEIARGVCRPNGRVFVVGDDRQAIYGFRGADSGSIDRLKRELKADELGLTTTYRCPKKVVALAQELVPDFSAAPEAPEGEVDGLSFEKLHETAKPGDFVLSRSNAPLAKACLRLLRHGTRARIEGRETGAGLLSIVKKVGGKTIVEFMSNLTVWEDRQILKLKATGKKAAEAKVELVHDQAETLRFLAEGMASTQELKSRIETLFTETTGKADYVVCSTVHRAKGLEADVVFVLRDTFNEGMAAHTEEKNIRYVAITRSKRKLTWVEGVK